MRKVEWNNSFKKRKGVDLIDEGREGEKYFGKRDWEGKN